MVEELELLALEVLLEVQELLDKEMLEVLDIIMVDITYLVVEVVAQELVQVDYLHLHLQLPVVQQLLVVVQEPMVVQILQTLV